MNQSKVSRTMNAVITTGEYFSQREQRQKKSYLTIGKLFIYHDGGMALKLDAMPTNGQMIKFYDIKPRSQHPAQLQPHGATQPQPQGYPLNQPPSYNQR